MRRGAARHGWGHERGAKPAGPRRQGLPGRDVGEAAVCTETGGTRERHVEVGGLRERAEGEAQP